MSEQKLSGLEPQLGGERRLQVDPVHRARAARHFEQALRHLEAGRWEDAVASLQGAIELVPNYPQAAGLLALAEEVWQAEEPDPPQIAALRAYVRELSAVRERMARIRDLLRGELRSARRPPAQASGQTGTQTVGIGEPDTRPDPGVSAEARQPYHPLFQSPGRSRTSTVRVGELSVPEPQPQARVDTLRPAPLRDDVQWRPFDSFRLVAWVFVDPEMLKAYYDSAGEESVRVIGAWSSSLLLWLPVLVLVLAMRWGTLPSSERFPPSWWLWGILVGWALTGVLECFGGFGLALALIGGAALVVWYQMLGSLPGQAMIALGAAFGVAMIVAIGIGSVLSRAEPGGVVTLLASVAALIVAIIGAWATMAVMMPFSGELMSGVGYTGALYALMSAVTAGAVGVVAFLLVFAATFAIVGSTVGLPVFFIAAALDESGGADCAGTVLRVGFLVALVAAYAVLVWVCFLGGWQAFA